MKQKFSALLLPLFFLLFSSWLMVHTFSYDSTQKNILIARTIWSDFGSHIPLIRSFSMGDNFDRITKFQAPEYPIFPGEPIRYHFLFYAFVGLLEKAGLRLDWALNIPSILGFTLLLWGIWSLALELFQNKKVAFLSVLFFLFNGSFAFIKFFKNHPLSLNTPIDILRANAFPAFSPWDGGDISAFWNLNIYTNQRHLASGFAIGIWFLIWVIRKEENHIKNSKHQAPSAFVWNLVLGIWNLREAFYWGLIIGIFPYFHQPMLIIMAFLMGTCFLFHPRLRFPLLISAMIGLIFIVPQLFAMPKNNVFAWHPGYLLNKIPNPTTFLSFWFANVGLHSILIPLGFFFIPNRAKKVLIPIFLLFITGNLFQFSVEVAANHKFFNFAAVLGNMISAYIVIFCWHHVYKHRLHSLIRLFSYFIICLFIGLLTLSGLIDFFVIVNDTKGTLADVNNNQTATWIAVNTPNDAIFLNSSFLYHPASLAGRKIFMGWPYFAWSAGYDTYKRNDEMKLLYESRDPKVFCPLLKQHNISFITVADTKNDPNLPTIDTTYFRNTFQPVFEDPIARQWIYASDTLCP